MKKLMNAPDKFVDEMLEGLTAAHPSLVREGPANDLLRDKALLESYLG